MYKFDTTKYKELLNGRTVRWLAKELCYGETVIYLILNGHKTCKKALALAIVKVLDDKNKIEDYFYEVGNEGE